MAQIQSGPNEQALEAVKRLCRAIIHDINNPLSAVSGYLQLTELRLAKLQSGDLTVAESLIDYHRKTQDALRRIMAMVQRLDRFSKVNLEPARTLNIRQFWTALIARREEAEQARIRLSCPDEDLTIHTLESCLEQIAFELLDNALWATRQEGNVQVDAATASSEQLVMEVRDSGPGMDAETLNKIMLPCYVTREGKGFPKEGLLLGLGLPIAHQLAIHLGGKLELHSQLGQGCRARLELPAQWVRESDDLPTESTEDTNRLDA